MKLYQINLVYYIFFILILMYFINKSKYDITIFMICTLYLNSLVFNKFSLIFALTVIYTLFFYLINNSKETFINNIRQKCKSNGKKHDSDCQGRLLYTDQSAKDADAISGAIRKSSAAAEIAATEAAAEIAAAEADAAAARKEAKRLERLFNRASEDSDICINKLIEYLKIDYNKLNSAASECAEENPIDIETNNGWSPDIISNKISILNTNYENNIDQYNEIIIVLKNKIKTAKNNLNTEDLKKSTEYCKIISNEIRKLTNEYKNSWVKLKCYEIRNQNFSLF